MVLFIFFDDLVKILKAFRFTDKDPSSPMSNKSSSAPLLDSNYLIFS